MKTRGFSLLTVAAALCAFAITVSAKDQDSKTTINACDSRITYIGRTLVKDGTVSFDWTGVYLRVKFQGKSLSVKASDTKKNYYNVWMDGTMDAEPDKVLATHGTDTSIVIFSEQELQELWGKGKKAFKEPHQVILQKRTEGEQGITTLISFSTEGSFLQADAPKRRVIEYVGDSYTCGFGSENSIATDPFTPETENQNKTYACAIARFFDAERIVVAHSGMGIARNYNGNRKDSFMPDLYRRTFDTEQNPEWKAADCTVKPDITVIYLGTNDFSTGSQPALRLFKKNYITLLKEIKDNYGENHPVLCVAPKNDLGMLDYIRDVVEDCGMKNIHLMALTSDVHNSSDDMGACWHPNYKGHIKKAYAIIPYISTITGWEMSGNSVK